MFRVTVSLSWKMLWIPRNRHVVFALVKELIIWSLSLRS